VCKRIRINGVEYECADYLDGSSLQRRALRPVKNQWKIAVPVIDTPTPVNRIEERTMKENLSPRRRFLKLGGAALAMIPALVISSRAHAKINDQMRISLKYQAKPEGDKSCANCMHFVPGAPSKSVGSCNILQGDTEISARGYCIAWAKKTGK
jgi:hypothetical protein